MTSRLGRIIIVALAAICAAIAIVILADVWSGDRGRTPIVATNSAVGGSFSLIDSSGAAVTEKSWPGKYLLIYFGYTYCPDVCPTELAAMAGALDAIGPDADKIQPLFISVDPARDTPEVMAGYAPMFYPRLVGLTGTESQVAAAAAAFKVYYRKAEAEGASAYLMDHTSFIYLVAPDGSTAAVLPPKMTPEEMAERLKAVVDAA